MEGPQQGALSSSGVAGPGTWPQPPAHKGPEAQELGGFKNTNYRTSLVAQWLSVYLLMQETGVPPLIWEDSTCLGATRPTTTEACVPQRTCSETRRHCNERCTPCNQRGAPARRS